MEIIDIGANLTHESFGRDLEQVLDRARNAGVVQLIVTGASEQGSHKALELATLYPRTLYATAGVHPHEADQWSDRTAYALEELAVHSGIVALGEMGLDFYRDYSPRPAQERAFEAQLELAAELGLPVFMHERDAHEHFVKILSRYRDRLVKGVLHCFTGTDEELAACLDMDLHVGITGWICDERRGLHLRELVGRIPPQRLMLETDAPYLLPRDLSPKPKDRRNEPANLPHILHAVARSIGQDPEALAESTTRTAREFFGLEQA